MGEEICWLSIPFLDPCPSHPLPTSSQYCPLSLSNTGLLQRGPLCRHSPFVPLLGSPTSLHTSSPREAGQVQMTPEAGQDSEGRVTAGEILSSGTIFARCWRLALPTWPGQARAAEGERGSGQTPEGSKVAAQEANPGRSSRPEYAVVIPKVVSGPHFLPLA